MTICRVHCPILRPWPWIASFFWAKVSHLLRFVLFNAFLLLKSRLLTLIYLCVLCWFWWGSRHASLWYFDHFRSFFCLLFPLSLIFVVICNLIAVLKVQVGNLLLDLPSEWNCKLVSTENPADVFAFETKDREGVNAWVSVTNSQLSIRVCTPTPSDAFLIYSHAHGVSKTHILNAVRYSENFLWEWILSKNSSAP